MKIRTPIRHVVVTYPWPECVIFAEGAIAGACFMLRALFLNGNLVPA